MQTKLTLAIAMLGFATLAQTAQAQSMDGATAPGSRSLTRAEVQADAALWRRAGLGVMNSLEGYDQNSPEYQQRLATYQRWRSGPEYQTALAQQQQGMGWGMMAKKPAAAPAQN